MSSLHLAAKALLIRPDIESAFGELCDAYCSVWPVDCLLTDTDGKVLAGRSSCSRVLHANDCAEVRKRAIEEALRWGEPSIQLCPGGYAIWAVPVMENARVLGGIIAEKSSVAEETSCDGSLSPVDVRRAAQDLLTRADEANLTNGALLELRRDAAELESHRAQAIHELKDHNYRSVREIYLVEEPALISAIKRGDRPAAREIINRVLVGIYYFGRERPTLLKSFLLELVAVMSRSAIEAGGEPAQLLGANYSSFADLAQIDTEEELCAWVVSMLERIMDAIKSNREYHSTVLLGAAVKYMEQNLNRNISRDDVAGVACLSPSHFSRVVKQTFGRSFTELLARMRVEKAQELLARTDRSLIQICLDCGFSDQSYFTKVFQKYTQSTPGEYRRLHRNGSARNSHDNSTKLPDPAQS